MAARGRPTSSTPEDTVETLAAKVGVAIPGDQQTRENRVAGLGVGAAVGVARSLGFRPNLLLAGIVAGAAAMAATDGPMAALGVSDPGTWRAQDWLTDAVPHLAYGLVAAAVVRGLDRAFCSTLAEAAL